MKNVFVIASLLLLSSCGFPHPFQSEAYKAGVSAGKELVNLQDTTDKISSWASSLGASENELNGITNKENCENIWLITGLLAYNLKNTPSNHKDFIAGCQSIVGAN